MPSNLDVDKKEAAEVIDHICTLFPIDLLSLIAWKTSTPHSRNSLVTTLAQERRSVLDTQGPRFIRNTQVRTHSFHALHLV